MKKAAFFALKQGSYFINMPWRNFIDKAALEEVLNTGHIAGAALDVGQAPDQMPTPSLAVTSERNHNAPYGSTNPTID